MTDKTKKSEGPSCACGKADLYEEWLQNQNNKGEVADSADACQIGDVNNSTDNKNIEDQKQTTD